MTVLTCALMAFLPVVSTRLCKAAPAIPMVDLLRVRCVPSAFSTRQFVTRMLRDNRRGATVFPKWHFAVRPMDRRPDAGAETRSAPAVGFGPSAANTRVHSSMARVPNAVLLLPTVRHQGLELGDQAVIDDHRLVNAAVVAGRPCLHDRDALLRQFGRAGIAMGFDQRLQQYFPLGADIRARGALPGGHRRLDGQRQECEEGGRRFPAHWLRAPCRHRLSSELTGQNETPWIRLRCLEAALGALDTAVGDADTSRSSAWRYGLSEA